jgi:hypothetical protein
MLDGGLTTHGRGAACRARICLKQMRRPRHSLPVFEPRIGVICVFCSDNRFEQLVRIGILSVGARVFAGAQF